jgi:hypothetical protein
MARKTKRKKDPTSSERLCHQICADFLSSIDLPVLVDECRMGESLIKVLFVFGCYFDWAVVDEFGS